MTKEIYLAGGCFWGVSHFFKQIRGVIAAQTGFANGNELPSSVTGKRAPSYEEVYTDQTGFAETVRVVYDPAQVRLDFLLRMFFLAIDPLSMNKQGEDEGTRYRTGIYYTNEEDAAVVEAVYREEQAKYAQPMAVEKEPLRSFYPADEYHQDYLDKHPDGYCHLPVALFEMARKANK